MLVQCHLSVSFYVTSAVKAAYNQFDDGIIKPFILLIPCRFYHLEKVINEVVVELRQLLLIQLLNPADLVHQIRSW